MLQDMIEKVTNLNQMENLYHIRERFSIIHDNKKIGIQMKWEGKREKPPMLMLPALSTISRSDETIFIRNQSHQWSLFIEYPSKSRTKR